MNEKQEKRAAAELPDELLDQAAGGDRKFDRVRCKRCGADDQPLYMDYCPQCRAELGI